MRLVDRFHQREKYLTQFGSEKTAKFQGSANPKTTISEEQSPVAVQESPRQLGNQTGPRIFTPIGHRIAANARVERIPTQRQQQINSTQAAVDDCCD